MELRIDRQILEAAATLLTGLGLGAVYEVLGVLRRHCGRLTGAALDVGFCLLAAWALFLLGMGPGQGTLRLYMPLLTFGGGAGWVWLFGRETRAAAEKTGHAAAALLRRLLYPLKKLRKTVKKYVKNLKNIFSRGTKWFTIIHNHATRLRRRSTPEEMTGEMPDETEAFQYIYEDRDPCAFGVRGDQPGQFQKPHRTGRG